MICTLVLTNYGSINKSIENIVKCFWIFKLKPYLLLMNYH